MTNKFDEKTEKLRKILSENIDSVPADVARQLELLVSDKKQKFDQVTGIAKDLSNVGNIVESVLSKNSNAFASDNEIIKDKLNQTIQALLDPIRITFSREIAKYIDAISTEDKQEKAVSNLINTPYSALSENGDFTIKNDKRINPEWIRLISSGYVPNVKDEDPKPTPESNYTKDKDNNEVSLTASVPSVVTNMAGVFKNSFKKQNLKPEIIASDNETSINIEGNLHVPDVSKSIKGTPIPKIKINYTELGDTYKLNASTSGSLYSNTYGLIPYFSQYQYSGKTNENLSQEIKTRISQLETNNCEPSGKKDIFSLLIYDKIKQFLILQENEDLSPEVVRAYSEKFKNLTNSMAEKSVDDFTSNRLLKKLPSTSYEHQKLLNKTEDENVLILLNLINFVPEPTEELKICGKEPHPLNLNLISELARKVFNNVASKPPCEDGEQDNPMVDAGLLATSLVGIRLSCFEYLLKSLFIYDQLKYSESLVNDPLLIDYISFGAQIELSQAGLYEESEKIIKKYYSFLKQEGFISAEDEYIVSSVEKVNISETATKNNKSADMTLKSPSIEFKVITSSMFRKSVKYVKKLTGTHKTELLSDVEMKTTFLGSLNIYDTYFKTTNKTYKNNTDRFKKINIDNQPFILERYISLPISKNNSLNDYMNKNYINGVIDFDNFTKFIDFIASGAIKGINKNTKYFDLFSAKPKVGVRLCLVEKTLVSKDNTFKISRNVTRDIKGDNLRLDKINNFSEFNEITGRDERYNGIVLVKKEIDVQLDDNKTLDGLAGPINENEVTKVYFDNKNVLLEMIKNDVDYKILFEVSLMSNKIPIIYSIYSNNALSTEKMKFLFSGTRKRLKRLNDSLKNIDNYTAKADYELAGGNAALLQSEFNNIGNPNSAGGFDLMWYLLTTPILILKGLTQLMDPNIAIASQIVNAAQAGLLLPKEDEQGNVTYPGDPITLPTVLASMMLLPINLLPPGLGIGPPVTPIPGMLYWALEPLLWKLPFFQNQTSKPGSDAARRAKSDYGLDIGAQNFSCEEDQDA